MKSKTRIAHHKLILKENIRKFDGQCQIAPGTGNKGQMPHMNVGFVCFGSDGRDAILLHDHRD